MATNLPANAVIGAVPPADAPMDPSQPLKADAGAIHVFDRETHQPTGEVLTPAALAAAHERTLQPLTFDQPVAVPAGGAAATEVAAPAPVRAAGPAPDQRPTDRTMPAASNTDTPSRGIPGTAYSPHREKDPLKVEGGFGGGTGEYFALSGDELLKVVQSLMDDVAARIENDLRFSIAITYPRYSVKVQIVVEAEAADQGFTVEKVAAKELVPLEIAQQHADSVVFVVTAQRREFNEHDEVETPVDALREQMDLRVPRKTTVHGPLGAMSSDVNLGI